MPSIPDNPIVPPLPAVRGRKHGLLLATSGVLILSVDSLLIRLAGTDSWTILTWRGGLMALSLGTAALIRDRRVGLAGLAQLQTWLIALSLSLSTAAFVLSIMFTRVANTVVIISAGPLFAALFSAWFLREKISWRTWLAIGGALVGVLVVCSASLGAGHLGGDLLALGNALFMGINMTLLRGNPQVSRSLSLALSGAVLALCCAPLASPLAGTQSLLVLAVMGLVQMPLSLLLLTSATRYLSAPEVSLFLLLETALAPLWVWWALKETVLVSTLVGGGLIVVSLFIYSLLLLRAEQNPP